MSYGVTEITTSYQLYILITLILILALGVVAIFIWKAKMNQLLRGMKRIGEMMKKSGMDLDYEDGVNVQKYADVAKEPQTQEMPAKAEALSEAATPQSEQPLPVNEGAVQNEGSAQDDSLFIFRKETEQQLEQMTEQPADDADKMNVVVGDMLGMGMDPQQAVDPQFEQPQFTQPVQQPAQPVFEQPRFEQPAQPVFEQPVQQPAQPVFEQPHFEQPVHPQFTQSIQGTKFQKPFFEQQYGQSANPPQHNSQPSMGGMQQNKMTFDTARSGKTYDANEIESIIKN